MTIGNGSNAQEILDLQTELVELQAEESAAALAEELMGSIAQAQKTLEAISKDAGTSVEDLEELQESLDQIADVIGETSGFLEASSEAVTDVAEGVGEFGEQASEVAGVLGQMNDAMTKVKELSDLSEAEATVQIRALSDLIKDITGWLGDLIDFIPGLGAFLEIWSLALESLSSSAAILESIVIKRNREAREAGLPEPYVILRVGSTARAERIEHITDRLEELGADLSPPEQSADGQTIPADVRNAITLGLRDGNISYSAFLAGSGRAAISRSRIKYLTEEIASANATIFAASAGDDIPTSEAAAARSRLPGLRGELSGAIETYEAEVAIIQPSSDAMFGYLSRYASEEAGEEWGPWMHSQFDPSYFLGPDALDAIRDSAGISEELTIPPGMSEAFDEDAADGSFDDMAARAGATVASLDATLDSEEDVDLDEFSAEPTSESAAAGASSGSSQMSPGTKKLIIIGGGGALAGMLLLGGFLLLSGDRTTPGDLKSADPEVEATPEEVGTEESTEVAAEAEEPVDPCTEAALGCQDMGLLPDPIEAMYDWTETSCYQTPNSAPGAASLSATSVGARLFTSGNGPVSSYLIGDNAVIGGGRGGGGTVTRDGVTTATQTVVEVVSVNADGFTATVETRIGPADDDGNLIAETAECEEGGTLDFSMDTSEWEKWIALPTTEEPVITISTFACSAAETDDGLEFFWAATFESPIPTPGDETPSQFGADIQARFSSWVNIPSPIFGSVGALPDPPGTWRDYQGHLIAAMPQEMADELGLSQEEIMAASEDDCEQCADMESHGETAVIGGYTFSPENGSDEAAALENFGTEDLIDAQVRITNGVFGAFAPSQICPQQ
jgi:hypothetical protein